MRAQERKELDAFRMIPRPSLSAFIRNLRFMFCGDLKRLIQIQGAYLKDLWTLFGNLDRSPTPLPFTLAQLPDAVYALIARIDATEQCQRTLAQDVAALASRLAQLQKANEAAGARLDALAQRHDEAVRQHIDGLTMHFAPRFDELQVSRREIAATGERVRAACGSIEQLVAATQTAIPDLAHAELRKLIAAVEEEEGVLALALGNAKSFTSTVAASVERAP